MRSLLALLSVATVAQAALVSPSMARVPASASAAVRRACVAAKLTDADGNDIKAALSSYMFFCAERRSVLAAELKAQHGAAFKQPLVMSALGAEWKALGEAEKMRFAAQATADKVRYDAAVASNPANAGVKSKRSPKKAGPKKLSAYLHFCAERRPSMTEELKASMGAAFKYPAVMSALGAEWKTLDATRKVKFEELAKIPVE